MGRHRFLDPILRAVDCGILHELVRMGRTMKEIPPRTKYAMKAQEAASAIREAFIELFLVIGDTKPDPPGRGLAQ